MYDETSPLSKLRFDPDRPVIDVGIVPRDGEAQAGPLLFRREIRLKNLLEITARNPRPLVRYGQHHTVILAGPRLNLNAPLSLRCLARVLEDVDQDLIQVISLHQ